MMRGVASVVGAEWVKLAAHVRVRVLLAGCLFGPVAFVVAMRLQSEVPSDTLFGRAVRESGFATPLVVLGFAGLWVLPALASTVAGDMFASEDRCGTWPMLLTRSRSRSEVFAGKVIVAMAGAAIAVAALGLSSVAAGLLGFGPQPLVDLSGVSLGPGAALARVSLAWVSVLPPLFGFTAVALLVSVATRSGPAAIGLPVLLALMMELYAYVSGSEPMRRLLLVTPFGAWHGLLTDPAYTGPLIDGLLVSSAYVAVCLATAHRLLMRRDIGD